MGPAPDGPVLSPRGIITSFFEINNLFCWHKYNEHMFKTKTKPGKILYYFSEIDPPARREFRMHNPFKVIK
jgi:hypothetical protein